MTRTLRSAIVSQEDRLALASRTQAEARLHAADVRITPARVRVLAALIDAGSACSHQDIRDMLAGIDRVTLYRALDFLTDANLAHKIAGDDRIFRFSAGADAPPGESVRADAGYAGSGAAHPHGHFKCTRCARVFCLGNEGAAPPETRNRPDRAALLRRQLQGLLRDSLGKGFYSHNIDLTILGWCADCSPQAGC